MTFWGEIGPRISKKKTTKHLKFSNVHIYSFHASKIQNLEQHKHVCFFRGLEQNWGMVWLLANFAKAWRTHGGSGRIAAPEMQLHLPTYRGVERWHTLWTIYIYIYLYIYTRVGMSRLSCVTAVFVCTCGGSRTPRACQGFSGHHNFSTAHINHRSQHNI